MHFNKSPHASEHIYYPFSGTVEPEEIGAAETTDAELSNELGWGQGKGFLFEAACGMDVARMLHGYYNWLISIRVSWILQIPGVWFSVALGCEGPSRWDYSSCYGVLGNSHISLLSRNFHVSTHPTVYYLGCVSLLGCGCSGKMACVLTCRPAPTVVTP